MIIVTGANGTLGRMVVERLLERVPAEQVGVSVREPEQARALQERGVRVRQGEFGDADSLAHAFEGASQVLVVSASALGETAVRLNRMAIEAAKAAGADRVLYTSHMGSNPESAFPPMHTHAATEAALQELGVPFTALRNGFYASSAAFGLRRALETGELGVPEDGPVAWTAHADLAEVAALALDGDDLDGLTPALTGSEEIDMAGIAEIASELTGRLIRRVVVPDADFRADLLAAGLPEPVADLSLGMFVASRQGAFVPADPTLTRLIDREPVSLRDVLKDALPPGR